MSRLWPCLLASLIVPATGSEVFLLLERYNSPPMPGTPAFHLMRSSDPWPTHPPDQWFVRNEAGLPEVLPPHWGEPEGFALDVGGEARWRWERFHNGAWGAIPDDTDGAWLTRHMLHADARIGGNFRIFGQLQSSEVWDKPEPVAPVDENHLDVHQLFGEYADSRGEDAAWRVRAGRQELHYGSGRLLTVREGPNVRLSFDAMSMRYATDGFSVDVFAGSPTETDANSFDDDWLRTDRGIWGAYATFLLAGKSPQSGAALDAYYIGVRNQDAVFFEGIGRELRHTLGTRLFGRQGMWDWNIEAMGQIGEFTSAATGDDGDLLAGAFSFDAGMTVDLPWKTRIGLKSDVITGDRDSGDGDLGTFNPLYPRGSYFGDIGLIGPANLLVVMPTLRTHFTPSFYLDLTGGFFWRQSADDGIYGAGGNPVRGPGGSRERFIGNQINALLGWTITRNLYLEFNYAHFFAGDFLEETGPSEDVDYAGITMAFRF